MIYNNRTPRGVVVETEYEVNDGQKTKSHPTWGAWIEPN